MNAREQREESGRQQRMGLIQWIVVIGGVVAIVLFFFWPPADPPGEDGYDFLTAVARSLPAVEADSLLFLNVPPAGGRYPGSIFLREGNVGLDYVSDTDAAFLEGQPAEAENGVLLVSGAGLSLNAGGSEGWLQAALGVLAERRDQVEVAVGFTGRTVESTSLVERVRDSEIARNITEAGVDAYVIFRAWRGTLNLKVRRQSDASVSVLDSLSASLDRIATSAGGDVRFSGDLREEREGEIRLAEDDVFAYEGYDVASFYRLAAGIAPDDPDLGGEVGSNPVRPRPAVDLDSVMSGIMRVDPRVIESDDLARSLERFGPETAEAVTRVMRGGDVDEWERGVALLERLPEGSLPRADLVGGIDDPDPTVRALSVLRLGDTPGADPTQELAESLEDGDPVVRYIAGEKLEAMGTEEAREALLTRTQPDDPAVASAVSAARFQEASLNEDLSPVVGLEQRPELALGVVHLTRADETGATGKLEVYLRGLESSDPRVIEESLRGIAELGRSAAGARAQVAAFLEDGRVEIRTLARRTLAEIRDND